MDKVVLHSVGDGVAITYPAGLTAEELVERLGGDAQVADAASLPGQEFRGAWRLTAAGIEVDLGEAKQIAHTVRRQRREEAFRPHDELIMKQIPGTDLAAVEAQRQKIRDHDAQVQAAIDAATTPDAIKEALQ